MPNMPTSQTYIKNVSISPKKLRFILDDVKKQSPSRALHMLKYSANRPSKLLYSALQSALTNAKNYLKTEEDLIQFRAVIIEEGQVLRRYRPGGRGTAKPIKKRYSHIKIVLGVKESQPVKAAQVKEIEAPKEEIRAEAKKPEAKKPEAKKVTSRVKKTK